MRIDHYDHVRGFSAFIHGTFTEIWSDYLAHQTLHYMERHVFIYSAKGSIFENQLTSLD